MNQLWKEIYNMVIDDIFDNQKRQKSFSVIKINIIK